jgi:hypothetical protein
MECGNSTQSFVRRCDYVYYGFQRWIGMLRQDAVATKGHDLLAVNRQSSFLCRTDA